MKANWVFNFGILLYLISYGLPFADGWWGLRIEGAMWYQALHHPDAGYDDISILWSFRWMINLMVLALWWLKTPEIRAWVILLTNKWLFDKLLLLIIFIFTSYPFLLENFRWQIGGILWAAASIVIAVSYQFLEKPTTPPPIETELEQHLVDFEED